jgi:hypothetical protein
MPDLIIHLIQLFLDCLPRPVRVTPTEEAALSWFYCTRCRRVGPGVYLVVPVIMYWRQYVVVSQICETAIVAVSTEDGEDCQWRIGIEYEVSDVVKYDVGQYSGQQHVEQLGAAELVRIISSRTAEQVRQLGVYKICRMIAQRIRDTAESRGVKIVSVRPLMASRCLPVFVSQAERLVD